MIAAGYVGYPTQTHSHSGGHLYFRPVPGGLVFAAALLIALMVAIGWALMVSKCKCDG